MADFSVDQPFRVVSANVSVDVTASALDDGSIGIAYWRLELLDDQGAVVQSDEGANPATVALTFTCSELGTNQVRVSGWDRDITADPTWEPCVRTETVEVTISDPLGLCP